MSKARSTKSSGNVFADIGVPDAHEHLAKADLVIGIANLIKSKGLSQAHVGALIGAAQPDVCPDCSAATSRAFLTIAFFDFLNTLGENVRVVV